MSETPTTVPTLTASEGESLRKAIARAGFNAWYGLAEYDEHPVQGMWERVADALLRGPLAPLQADLIVARKEREHFRDRAGDLFGQLMLAEKSAAQLRSRLMEAEQAAEAMQTELRPFAEGEGEGLDEVVIHGATTVHAETMSDTSLWIGIGDQHGGLVHVWVNAVRRKGKLAIVMTATDEGDRGTIGQGTAQPAPLSNPTSEDDGGKP